MHSVDRKGLALSAIWVLVCINYGGVLVQTFSSDSCPLSLVDRTGNICRFNTIKDVFHISTVSGLYLGCIWFVLRGIFCWFKRMSGSGGKRGDCSFPMESLSLSWQNGPDFLLWQEKKESHGKH